MFMRLMAAIVRLTRAEPNGWAVMKKSILLALLMFGGIFPTSISAFAGANDRSIYVIDSGELGFD